MKHVLVTGGAGFIGGYVVEALLAKGYHPVVLDTRGRPLPDGVELKLGDTRDATAVNEAVAHSDGVIHLAGVLGTQETISNPRPAAETNILGGLNVLEAIVQYDLPAVNIAVGNWWMASTYSLTKSTMERFAYMLNVERNAKITVVRALNAYGPRQVPVAPWGPSKVRKIMPSFVCRALSGLDIEVFGDGEQVMDMIYVADVANVLVSALEQTNATGRPVYGHGPDVFFNNDVLLPATLEAGTGRPTTVNDIANVVLDEVGRVTGRRPSLVHLPMRPGEPNRSKVLGNPLTLGALTVDTADFVSLEEGVERTVAYFNREVFGGATTESGSDAQGLRVLQGR